MKIVFENTLCTCVVQLLKSKIVSDVLLQMFLHVTPAGLRHHYKIVLIVRFGYGLFIEAVAQHNDYVIIIVAFFASPTRICSLTIFPEPLRKMERTRLSVALILFLYILPVTFTQECDLPTEEEILALLENEIISQGGEEEMVNAVLDSNLTFTCLATSGSLKMYNAFSVVLRYREQPGDPLKVGQFEGECVTSGGNTGWQTTDNLRPASGSLLDLSTREDCYACRDVFNEDSCLCK